LTLLFCKINRLGRIIHNSSIPGIIVIWEETEFTRLDSYMLAGPTTYAYRITYFILFGAEEASFRRSGAQWGGMDICEIRV